MKTAINWGIMALGKIAHPFADAINHVQNAKLYAVASRTTEKAEEFAVRYGAEKAYGSYEELVCDKNVDIIYIASPMSCHYENARLCLEAGKNVLCEKSITLNSGELEELIAIAREKNVFFMEAMWMKFMPAFKQAKKWVAEGMIGEIELVRADFSCVNPYDPANRLFKPELGGGALLDLGVYPLTFITSFLGFEPEKITSSAVIENGIDVLEQVCLFYKEAVGVSFSGFDKNRLNNAQIFGTKGSISFGNWFHSTDTVVLTDANGNVVERFRVPHPHNGYEYEIEECCRCVANGLSESPDNPLAHTAAVMRLMDKLRAEWGLVYPQEQ